jgi:D-alanyl-D-alanine dipeptidase
MTKLAVALLLTVLVLGPLSVQGSELPLPHQVIVVISQTWSDPLAKLYRFEQMDDGWKQVNGSFTVVVGEKGMGWDGGAAGKQASFPEKREGDGKAPAGLFPLVMAMGYDAKAPSGSSFPYRQIEDVTRCVDDPDSPFYNQIIKESDFNTPLAELWKSSERMKLKDDLYKKLVLVDYNRQNPQPGAGSCIFIHIWRSPAKGTSGCTAMAEKDLDELLRWLKNEENPVLVQLPKPVYKEFWKELQLPAPELFSDP